MSPGAEGLVDIGRLVLQFARVNRTTFHEDGTTPESDTDHTVMLSVCACALAEKLYNDSLDIGLVSQFAIVHDLVEAYASDTDTFGMSDEERKKKDVRERESFSRIQKEFQDIYPWIPDMIERYEKLDTKEARFVKTVDKLMTRVTHILNYGAYFKGRGFDHEQMWKHYEVTRVADIRYGKEFPEVIALIDETIEEASKRTYGL